MPKDEYKKLFKISKKWVQKKSREWGLKINGCLWEILEEEGNKKSICINAFNKKKGEFL